MLRREIKWDRERGDKRQLRSDGEVGVRERGAGQLFFRGMMDKLRDDTKEIIKQEERRPSAAVGDPEDKAQMGSNNINNNNHNNHSNP